MNHPYKDIPTRAHWFKQKPDDPIIIPRFTIKKEDKIVSAGSCFARRIATSLKKRGQYLITEALDPVFTNECVKYNYGIFSARYDNIYTAKQLLQLFERAYGEFKPEDGIWLRSDGKFIDAFRPRITPGGYFTVQELIIDRKNHFNCVRQAFEKLDVFIFTLGLTEAWLSKKDNAVYPLCPGVDGGSFDHDKYYLKNFTTTEIISDFLTFTNKLQQVNPNAKIIITVSPTPIIATATNNHILTANFYTKSALRAACSEIILNNNQIDYFPSYELILSGCFSELNNFEVDGRTPTENSIANVMNTFFQAFFEQNSEHSYNNTTSPPMPSNFGYEICDNILEEFQSSKTTNTSQS